MKNEEVSKVLYEIADFLEMKGVDYKPRAYRKAARKIESLTENVKKLKERGDLKEIEGIGESISEKISEYLKTGEIEKRQKLQDEVPVDIESLTKVEGVGPKSAKDLYKKLNVETLEDLKDAAEAGRLKEIEGFGEKSQQNILKNLNFSKEYRERKIMGKMEQPVSNLISRLRDNKVFNLITIVGSYRRRKPTIGDVDILALAKERETAMDTFCELNDVKKVIAKGNTKSSIVITDGVQVDLRLVEESSYGSAIIYFTGSKDHNIALRNRAKNRDWKLNEYGLFDSGETKLAGETEKEVYDQLDLSYIPPELRENTGEIRAAEEGSLPNLVEPDDIKGDLHVHTDLSGGKNSVKEMAQRAEGKGHDYLLISDHGPYHKTPGNMRNEDFEKQKEEVEKTNDEMELEILQGIEATITEDGLDVTEEWYKNCDVLTVGLHDRQGDPTKRIISALDEYPVDILAHPQGRKLLEKQPLDMDLERIVKKAAKERVAIEINSRPSLLDLDWQRVKEYRDEVKFVISTDAYSKRDMDYIHLGVSQARKGWCESGNVLNTKPLEELGSYLEG